MSGIKTYRTLVAGLSLAATLFLGASCAKMEIGERADENIPVSFGTYGQRRLSSKAGASFVAPGGDFAVGSQIGVFGYYHDASD